MPDKMIWPLSGSVCDRSVGSSPTSAPIASTSLSSLGLALGFDGYRDDGVRELDPLQEDRRLLVAERVPSIGPVEPNRGHDVAREGFLKLLSPVRVHPEQAPDAGIRLLRRVVDRGPPLEDSE